jgi:thiamine kinase-like enzyme
MTLTASCHGDLNPSNIFFLGYEFKVIDFEGAAQSNPYKDIATIANSYCFTPASEHILLSSYLEREPSAKEWAQLYVMKQVVWLGSGLSFLKRVPEEIGAYSSSQAPARQDLLTSFDTGEIDLEKAENKMIFGKSMLDNVLANSKSQEFRDAIELLLGNKSE